ncbi:hypothetical protein CEXT_426591 [Caerostris extrusa]|uniref:Uncharacterized protein n=1 Tax=Caerostris extrusa TaxID=172846 RepID=A0AAV4Y1Q3_CAEEX|nr:hypothetical protein CEXT_426591 [Caerostris extrusa]
MLGAKDELKQKSLHSEWKRLKTCSRDPVGSVTKAIWPFASAYQGEDRTSNDGAEINAKYLRIEQAEAILFKLTNAITWLLFNSN